MKKVNIFSVFLFNPFRRPSKKYLLFLFMTMAILLCYGFLFTNKVHAEEEVIIPTEVLEVTEVSEVSEVSTTIIMEEIVTPTEVSSDIETDTIWTKEGSPYIINASIYVYENVTLTINKGVVVKFVDSDPYNNYNRGYSIDIAGKLVANGTTEEPIYFTSNFDDELGGSTDEHREDCNFESYDEEGNGIGEEICELVDQYNPSAGNWDELSFDSPEESILNNVYIRYAGSGITLESSKISSENLNIKDSLMGFTGYNDSTAKINGGNFENLGDAFTIFNNSSLVVNGITLKNVNTGFTGFTGSGYYDDHPEVIPYSNNYLTVTDSTIDCTKDGITIFNEYSLNMKGGSISCPGAGITLFEEVKADIDGVKILVVPSTNDGWYDRAGIVAFNNTKPDTILIKNSDITGGEYGLLVWDSTFSAHRNNIHDNTIKGVDTYDSDISNNLDFTSNFWGDKSGPKNETSNPTGLGNEVADNILFTPFLKYDPLKPGVSNILFIPGFQSSRLYKETGDSEDGTGYEKKLWEPGVLSNARELFMDENGESIDKNIYTRDVMSTATVFGLGVLNIYKSFFEKLDGMVANGEISNWKVVPYDWRFSPFDIVRRGVEKSNGNISYTEELSDGQVPYIIDQLQKLSDSSNNGKVTIVTHSNGGLVAKALIARLMAMKASGESNLIDDIDNLVAVAPPLLGTPKAIAGVLHGYDQGIFGNMLLTKKDARDLGQTIPGAFGLLTSEKYLSDVNNDLILLDPSLSKINDWISKYGESIDTYDELENFILDVDNLRTQPSHSDLVNPTILNKNILEKAKLLHDTIDNLVIPSSIKVHQVAGWGLPTVNDIRYKSKNECASFIKLFCKKKKVVLSADAGFTSGGDATVVSGSALFGVGEKYYLNLEKYNKDAQEGKIFYSGKDHANIFEVPYVYDLIRSIVKANPSLPSYITKDEPSPIEYTVLKMRSPVAIDIYDGNGFHTGVIEGTDGASDTVEENIPNSLYMEIGDNKYIVVPKEGNYKLELTGLSDGIFTLEEEQLVNNLPGESVVWKDIPTTALFLGEVAIEGGELATSIAMDENGDGEFESTLDPVDNSLKEEKEDDIIERHSISGSYMVINRETPLQNVVPDSENIEMPIIIKETKDESLNNKVISKMIAIKTTKEIAVPEAEGNTLTASAGAVYSQNPIRFKWQLMIAGSFLLLLGGLKFIFKLI